MRQDVLFLLQLRYCNAALIFLCHGQPLAREEKLTLSTWNGDLPHEKPNFLHHHRACRRDSGSRFCHGRPFARHISSPDSSGPCRRFDHPGCPAARLLLQRHQRWSRQPLSGMGLRAPEAHIDELRLRSMLQDCCGLFATIMSWRALA
jgi:hypothetical protein